MRIIAGSAKGAKLAAPSGFLTRPTPERVREALFNIISDRLAGCRFLDLFAGSAAIGLEALSRGAGYAVFADNRRQSVDIIYKNIDKARLGDIARVLNADAHKAIRLLADEGRTFDIVYLDPPYGSGLVEKTVYRINEYGILAENGIIIAERDESEAVTVREPLAVYRQNKYGGTILDFIRRE
jgi:16S rRNA (guanine(966)-N(2))-methyltransferase RsmD